jgi:hypothetical protein
LFVPFYAILVLLGCKRNLDRWLQQSLNNIQKLRKAIITTDVLDPTAEWSLQKEKEFEEEQKYVVSTLGNFIMDSQDVFSDLWSKECEPRVVMSTRLLFFSMALEIALVAFMFWVFLIDNRVTNADGVLTDAPRHWVAVAFVGFAVPCAYTIATCLFRRPRARSAFRSQTLNSAPVDMSIESHSSDSFISLQAPG